ncbi:MAG: redoxin domain-containing protein [Chloroflexi bacterium]|nr:redoxin domain-containing protein [Chloroflexota bacterium]
MSPTLWQSKFAVTQKFGVMMTDAIIAVGQVAPDFSLPASIGQSPLSLSSLRGKTVVLAFYVLDFTDT